MSDERQTPEQWLRMLAGDMSLAERLYMKKDGRYSKEDIDSEVDNYEQKIRWYLGKMGLIIEGSLVGTSLPSHLPSNPTPITGSSQRNGK